MPPLPASSSAQGRIASLASATPVHRALYWLHLHQPQVKQWLFELVRIPAPTFGEGDRAAWFAERFRDLGLSGVHLDEVGNALGELRCGNSGAAAGGPVVLLSAHLDTVFPTGTECEPRDDAASSRTAAPGITDNGAGLSGLLALAAALRFAGILPPATILFAANVGEEGEGDLRGMRHLFESGTYAGRIRAAIALEGAGTATVVDRALGSRRLRVTVTTPGGHSWADFGAPNAIALLAGMLVELESLGLPREPRTTLNIGKVDGGTSVNSIAARASALLDIRSIDSAELARVDAEVRARLAHRFEAGIRRAPGTPAPELTIESIGERPAAALAEDAQLLQTVRAVDRHLRLRTEPRVGSTDANLPLSLGIPAIAMAAGGTGGGVHTLEEWYDGSGREIALRRVLLTLLDTAEVVAAGASGTHDQARLHW